MVRLTGQAALLHWCQEHGNCFEGVNITNFTTDWSSGLGFCALVARFRPDLLDYESLDRSDRKTNITLAFDAAEKAGIPKLLDVEDMLDLSVPDKLSVITYLGQFFQAFSNEKPKYFPKKKETSLSTESGADLRRSQSANQRWNKAVNVTQAANTLSGSSSSSGLSRSSTTSATSAWARKVQEEKLNSSSSTVNSTPSSSNSQTQKMEPIVTRVMPSNTNSPMSTPTNENTSRRIRGIETPTEVTQGRAEKKVKEAEEEMILDSPAMIQPLKSPENQNDRLSIEKQRQEEQQKLEMEKKEAEKRKEEEEKLRQEQEKKARDEEKRKQEDERKKREEEKKKEEAERKKLEEERKKQEAEKLRLEQAKKLEEEKKKKEEEKKKLEEKQKLEESKRRQEEDRKTEEKRNLEEKRKLEEDERKKKEETQRRERFSSINETVLPGLTPQQSQEQQQPNKKEEEAERQRRERFSSINVTVLPGLTPQPQEQKPQAPQYVNKQDKTKEKRVDKSRIFEIRENVTKAEAINLEKKDEIEKKIDQEIHQIDESIRALINSNDNDYDKERELVEQLIKNVEMKNRLLEEEEQERIRLEKEVKAKVKVEEPAPSSSYCSIM